MSWAPLLAAGGGQPSPSWWGREKSIVQRPSALRKDSEGRGSSALILPGFLLNSFHLLVWFSQKERGEAKK